jgi:hypothetical protein
MQGLASDRGKWPFTTWGLVEAFNRWQLSQGSALSSVNVRPATIKVSCQMAAKAGYLSPRHDWLEPWMRAVDGSCFGKPAKLESTGL